jgi:hypothetical protein
MFSRVSVCLRKFDVSYLMKALRLRARRVLRSLAVVSAVVAMLTPATAQLADAAVSPAPGQPPLTPAQLGTPKDHPPKYSTQASQGTGGAGVRPLTCAGNGTEPSWV